VDWLSLVGDASDNIPGVPGVGTKTAAELLGQFGSVGVLYERLAEVKSARLRASLEAAAERVRRNQQLIRLGEGVSCDLALEDLAERGADMEALRRLYRGWGFRNLLQGLEEAAPPEMEELFDEKALSG
jgi:DNA polymerase-1